MHGHVSPVQVHAATTDRLTAQTTSSSRSHDDNLISMGSPLLKSATLKAVRPRTLYMMKSTMMIVTKYTVGMTMTFSLYGPRSWRVMLHACNRLGHRPHCIYRAHKVHSHVKLKAACSLQPAHQNPAAIVSSSACSMHYNIWVDSDVKIWL